MQCCRPEKEGGGLISTKFFLFSRIEARKGKKASFFFFFSAEKKGGDRGRLSPHYVGRSS